MLHDEVGDTTSRVEDSAAQNRRGLLIETVATGIADILNAASASAVLPQVLTKVAKLVRIDRLVMVEIGSRGQAARAHSVFYLWQATNAVDSEQIGELIK